jgi:hypothetical protein
MFKCGYDKLSIFSSEKHAPYLQWRRGKPSNAHARESIDWMLGIIDLIKR